MLDPRVRRVRHELRSELMKFFGECVDKRGRLGHSTGDERLFESGGLSAHPLGADRGARAFEAVRDATQCQHIAAVDRVAGFGQPADGLADEQADHLGQHIRLPLLLKGRECLEAGEVERDRSSRRSCLH